MKKTVLFLLLLAALPAAAIAKGQLSLEDYLAQVEENNPALKASRAGSEGVRLRLDDPELLLAPTLSAQYTYLNDKKEQTTPSFMGTKTTVSQYNVGISKLTRFGLFGKLSYTLEHDDIHQATLLPVPNYYLATPKLEISQSLIRNGFGSETSAAQDAQLSANRASHYGQRFQALSQLVDSENAYWRLAIARRTVEVQKGALARAEKILTWAERRVKNQLGDRSDMLQAQAQLEVRKLELRQAEEEEQAASRAFNTGRGEEGESVPETLDAVDSAKILRMQAPVRAEKRLDVLAAEEQEKAAIASNQLTKEKAKPNLDIFASYAPNGRDAKRPAAVDEGWTTKFPTFSAGVKFSTPLYFGLMYRTQQGAEMEKESARLNFRKKLLDQEQDWHDLTTRLRDARTRLDLAKTIENIQRDKYENERQRLLRGRTTTYQELLFEQDLAQAELVRVRTQAEVLRILAQMKLFRGDL